VVGATIALLPGNDGLAIGTLGLQAPHAGVWQLQISVAGYDAPTLVTLVN
jgi:hypothetical protein